MMVMNVETYVKYCFAFRALVPHWWSLMLPEEKVYVVGLRALTLYELAEGLLEEGLARRTNVVRRGLASRRASVTRCMS